MPTLASSIGSMFGFSSHPDIVIHLLFLCLLSILRGSCHALPATPPGTSLSIHLQNARSLERAIEILLLELSQDPNPGYNEAQLTKVFFAIDPIPIDRRLPVEPASSNIADFRSILCAFDYGGPRPPDQYPDQFLVRNRGPQHPQLWSRPQDVDEGPIWAPFDWYWAIAQMPLGTADRLLKNAGFRGTYVLVELRSIRRQSPPGLPPTARTPAWCFHNVMKPNGNRVSVGVDGDSATVLVNPVYCV